MFAVNKVAERFNFDTPLIIYYQYKQSSFIDLIRVNIIKKILLDYLSGKNKRDSHFPPLDGLNRKSLTKARGR